jgi:hypothetical protein
MDPSRPDGHQRPGISGQRNAGLCPLGLPSGKLADYLPDLRPEHPRLLITDPAMEAMRATAKNDPLFAR